MLYYLPLFLILCLSSLVEVWDAGRVVLCGKDNRRQEWLLIAVTMFAVLFIGLRYYTGADWNIYIAHFIQSASIGNSAGFEKGYYFLNKFILLNTDNYYLLQLLASCFILISSMRFFKNNGKYPVLIYSIFILVFLGALMAQIRQTIALGFIFISVRYIFERKFLLFLLMVVIACQFHISAIIALPLYFFNRNCGKILPIILIIVSQVSYLYPHFLVSFVEIITPYLPGRLSVISTNYLTKATFFIRQQEIQSGYYYIARVLLAVFVIAFAKPGNGKEFFFINTLTIATCIKGLSMGMSILERFADYYLIFGVASYIFLLSIDIHIPKWLKFSLWLRVKLFVITFFIIVFFAIPLWRSVTSDKISELNGRPGSYRYVPYYNVLYHSEDANKRKDWNE
ncbi:MAG: EpsG family protein [Bacteroidales bacterium]|jgi:hypothetical protein|nr:EpsG family protein [Bacteroidales bacterium]